MAQAAVLVFAESRSLCRPRESSGPLPSETRTAHSQRAQLQGLRLWVRDPAQEGPNGTQTSLPCVFGLEVVKTTARLFSEKREKRC